MIEFLSAVITLIFILWFTGSVVGKLKRSEYLLRELLRCANPQHPIFANEQQSPQPSKQQEGQPKFSARQPAGFQKGTKEIANQERSPAPRDDKPKTPTTNRPNPS